MLATIICCGWLAGWLAVLEQMNFGEFVASGRGRRRYPLLFAFSMSGQFSLRPAQVRDRI